MFECTLCCETLSNCEEILGTFCGHIFHHDCLNQHLSKESSLCPSCRKCLRADLTSVEAGYAVIPLHPKQKNYAEHTFEEERNQNKTKLKNATIYENIMLKRKLVEIYQALIVLQKARENEKGMHKDSAAGSFESPGANYKFPRHGLITNLRNNIVANKPESNEPNNNTENTSFETATEDLDLLDSDLVTLWIKPYTNPLPEEEKNRILRSKRRLYLTWRNKAYSWLSKMELACDRLLYAEQIFCPIEHLQDVRMFFNKIYNQGRIIDTAKQSAVVHLIMDQVADNERNEIQTTILGLNKTYCNMLAKVMDQLNILDSQNAEKAMTNRRNKIENDQCFQSMSTSIDNSDRCSSLSEEDTSHIENSPSLCEIKESNNSQTCPSNFVLTLSIGDEDDTFREPIFV